MNELLTIPMITAIVAVLKSAGLPSKYAPLASVMTGIAVAVIYMDAWWTTELMVGLVLGLSASGLYSGGKTLLKN